MSVRRYLSADRTEAGGGMSFRGSDAASESPRGHTGTGERAGAAKADPDHHAPVSGSVTSGDAAKVGGRVGGGATRGGGATGRGNLGDAGDGSIDATDATRVAGDEATTEIEDEAGTVGSTTSGGREPTGTGRGAGRPRTAPGALGPEDLDTSRRRSRPERRRPGGGRTG